jgi:peptidoglycan/LPS O-acetylase OafA/YrhL
MRGLRGYFKMLQLYSPAHIYKANNTTDVRTKSIEEALEHAGGRPTGFDYLRLILSIAVIAIHEPAICFGYEAEKRFTEGPVRPLIAIILLMFFSLSGFLVAGSLERCRTLVTFMGLRAIRIMPALAVEVLLSALILGPLLTSYTLHQYVSDPLFARYFLNLVGDVQISLPGVFSNNPAPHVNPQLWTVPFELLCYIALGVLAAIGVTRHRFYFLVAVLGFEILRFIRSHPGAWLWQMTPGGHVDGRRLVTAFLAGVAIYLYRDVIVVRKSLFWPLTAFTLVILFWMFGDWIAPFTAAYVTVFLGVQNPPKWPVLAGADYSYGMYIYGYPIQQAFAYFGILLWPVNLTLSLLTAGVFAAFSWHCIEKPALRLRTQLRPIEERWLKAKEGIRLLVRSQ